MRKALYSRLVNDVDFLLLVEPSRVFGSGSIGIGPESAPDAGDGLFAYLQVHGPEPVLGENASVAFGTMVLSVHAERGSYIPIEDALRAARGAFRFVGFPSENGWIAAVEWQEDSEELFDDELRTIYKTCTWRVVVSGERSV